MATYYLSTTGLDTNSGLSLSLPWLTFNHAAATLVAGDTVLVRGGTYSGNYLQPAFSGTAGNPITVLAYQGEVPIVTGAATFDLYFNFVGKSWWIIDGISFQNTTSSNLVIYLDGASNITIRNCLLVNHAGQTWIFVRGNNNTISSNHFDTNGSPAADGSGDAIYVGGSYNLIDNNYFTKCGHYACDLINDGGTYSHHNIIRGNLIEQHWGGGLGVLRGSHDNIVEDNTIYFVGEGVNYPKAAIQVAAETNIVRRNIMAKMSASPYPDQGLAAFAYLNNNIYENCRDNRIYNNVIYKAGRSAIDVNQKDASINANNKFVNNIMYYNRVAGSAEPDTGWPPGNYYVTFDTYHANANNKWATFANGNVFLNNIILHADVNGDHPTEPRLVYYNEPNYGDSLAGVQSTYPAVFSGNLGLNPLFVNAEARDFHVQAGSPAIDAGVFLAKTTAGGTNTVTIPVDDPFFFTDGFGLMLGDMVRVGNNSAIRVTAVDNAAKTLTLASPITFANQDKVTLDYQGAAPDIGLYEFIASGPPPAATFLRSHKHHYVR